MQPVVIYECAIDLPMRVPSQCAVVIRSLLQVAPPRVLAADRASHEAGKGAREAFHAAGGVCS